MCLAASKGMGRREISGAVVGHQALDRDPVGAVEGQCSPQEGDGSGFLLVWPDLDVGKPGGVLDANVDELPACPPPPSSVGGVGLNLRARRSITRCPAPWGPILPDFFTSMWINSPGRERSWRRIGSGWLELAQLAQPDPRQHRRYVEVVISTASAISGPVSRSRRSAAIASARSTGGGVVDGGRRRAATQ